MHNLPGETRLGNLKVEVPGVEYNSKYPTPIEEVRRRIFKQLSDTPWSHDSWPLKVPLFAFITGPLRDKFEELKDPALRNALREFVNKVFVAPSGEGAPIEVRPVSEILSDNAPPSYFIGDENEGQMELFAVRKMYAQMYPGSLFLTLALSFFLSHTHSFLHTPYLSISQVWIP